MHARFHAQGKLNALAHYPLAENRRMLRSFYTGIKKEAVTCWFKDAYRNTIRIFIRSSKVTFPTVIWTFEQGRKKVVQERVWLSRQVRRATISKLEILPRRDSTGSLVDQAKAILFFGPILPLGVSSPGLRWRNPKQENNRRVQQKCRQKTSPLGKNVDRAKNKSPPTQRQSHLHDQHQCPAILDRIHFRTAFQAMRDLHGLAVGAIV